MAGQIYCWWQKSYTSWCGKCHISNWFYMSRISKIGTQFQSTKKWFQQNTINNQHSDIGETKTGSSGDIFVGTLYLTSSLLARADESFGKKSLETWPARARGPRWGRVGWIGGTGGAGQCHLWWRHPSIRVFSLNLPKMHGKTTPNIFPQMLI